MEEEEEEEEEEEKKNGGGREKETRCVSTKFAREFSKFPSHNGPHS